MEKLIYKKGSVVTLKSIMQLEEEYYLNEHNEFVFSSVDTPKEIIESLQDKELHITHVDDDGDLKFSISHGVVGSEAVLDVIDYEAEQ